MSQRAFNGGERIARRKLSHEIQDRLLARIRSGEYTVGTLLPSERELMLGFGVGRPAVREALQSLERMGLISILHGEGARVLPVSADELIGQISEAFTHLLNGSSDMLEHLKEARLHFEVAMVRLAAQRATAAQIEELRSLLEAHRATQDNPEHFLQTDIALHRGIAAVSGNSIYMAVSHAVLQWLTHFHHDAVRAPGVEKITFNEHAKVVDRIAQHDPEGAAKAMTAHLKRANRLYGLQADQSAAPAPR